MKQKKKLLSMVLCIIMLLTQFQCVYAGEDLSDTAASVTESGGVSETSSGTDSTKTDGGTDVVSGSGESEETGGKIDVSQETDSSTTPDSSTETKSEIDAGKTPDTSTETKPETDAGKTPETSTETKPGTDAGKTPETSTETKPGTDASKTPETSTETKPETDAGTTPDTSTETKPGTDAGKTPDTSTETKPGTDAGKTPETSTETKPGTDAGTVPDENTEDSETTQPAIETTQPAIETTSEPAIEVEIPLGPWDGVTTAAAISKDNVYQIGTASQLAWFMVKSNGNDLNAVLTTDIDLNNHEWTFIPSEGYGGNFDGQGHTIKGFRIGTEEKPAEDNYKSLFGYLSGSGKIQNLKLVGEMHLLNCDYVGAFAGKANNANFINCINQVNITMNGEGNNLGGIVGYINNGGTIEGCRNEGKLSGCNNVGGLVGSNNWWDTVIMISCINNGTISGKDCVGGLAGNFTKGEIKNSFVTGSIFGEKNMGGLVGNRYRSIVNSFYYNQATPLKIVGSKEGTITNCYYLESSNGEYSESIGGISKDEKAFSGYEVLYFLNGCELHDTIWSQGKLYPVFGNAAQKVYCISFLPYAIKSTVTVTINNDSNQFNIITNSAGIQSLYVKSGSRVTFTVSDEKGKEVQIQPMPQECSLVDGKYIINVLDKNVKIVYGTKDEFSKPTISWYDSNFSTYNIATEEELLGIQPLFLGETPYGKVDLSNKTILLSNDINLTKEWIPIGTSESSFNGTLDGQGHSINGLSIGSKEKPVAGGYQGFLANNSGTIQNLTISGNIYSIGDYVGGIVGYNKGKIENCTYESGSVSGKDYVGGIAGYNDNDSIKNLKNGGAIFGENYIGGIFGKSEDSIYESSYLNSGKVTAKNNYVGGIAGYVEGTVKSSENNGDITGNNYVGGIAGYVDGRILEIQSKGTIKGVDYIGGIAGYVKDNITGELEKKTVSGNIIGNNYVGGIAGYVGGDISTVTVASDSTVSGVELVGGIVGEHDGVEINNFIVLASVNGSKSGTIAGRCKLKPDVKNGFYYCLSDKNPVLVGTGDILLEDVYYLAEKENESGAKTAEQFASGEVAWRLDGGETTKTNTTWTQNKNDKYPSLGDNPVFKICLIAETPITTENAIKMQAGIAETKVDSNTRTQIVYLKKGEEVNLEVTLADSYEVIFTPTIDFHIKDGKYVTTVDKNYDVKYNFAVNVPAAYEWYLNPTEGTDGKKLYNIKTENELKGFSNLVNGIDFKNSGQSEAINFIGDTVNIISDLNLESGNWSAIGTSGAAFSGTFDGNNRAITGLKLSSMNDNQGLFGYIKNATIKNLSVTGRIDNSGEYTGGIVGCALGNCNFENLQFGKEGKIIGRSKYTGGIVGGSILTSEGQKVKFINCKNNGLIQGTSDAVGGIVGIVTTIPSKINVDANFTNCENLGEVIGDASYTGGIIGVVSSFSGRNDNYIYTTFDNNINSGRVKGCKETGGIIGYLTGSKDKISKVFNCYNAGTVTGRDEDTGGIVGYKNSYSEIKACYNIGNVEGEVSNTGGIAGKLLSYPGYVRYCYNAGTVTGSAENTGGIAGYASSDSNAIVNNYNEGNVTGKDNVGGIIGSLSSDNFKNNYNVGSVLATGNAVGGIIGLVKKSGSNIQACYNTGKVEGKGSSTVVGGITGENSFEAYGSGWFDTLKRYKANSLVSGCYNTGQVLSDKGTTGNITGRYFELNENCYALNSFGSDKKYVTIVTKEQFESAQFAYLLDGGDKQNRTTNWTQGEKGPIFTNDPNKAIYRITINVNGKGKLSDEICNNISESETRYICNGTEINLLVVPDDGQKLLKLCGSDLNGKDINDFVEDNKIIKFSMPSSNVDITAIFADKNVLAQDVIVVIFNASGGVFNDGKAITTTIINKDGKLSFPETPKKEGYSFKGWYDAKSEGNQISEGMDLTSDVTYYAQWTKVEGNFAQGDGSEENPYIISGTDDLYLMAGKVNSGDTNYIEKYYKIADDVENITIGDDWEAIGNEKNPFSGVFDGSDTRIKSKANTGIFGKVRYAEIRNFRLDTDICGDRMVGGVVNYFSGDGASKTLSFENITVTGNVTGISGVGGLLGGTDLVRCNPSGIWDLVKIRECRNAANISTNEFMAGGLAGYLYPEFEIENCINTGNVTSGHADDPMDMIDVSAAGGLVGWFISGRINRCVNTGDIRGDEAGVGGLLGYVSFDAQAKERYIKNSYNLGNITASDTLGGIAGRTMAVKKSYNIENCYNYGTIDAINKRGKYGAISSDAGDKSVNCYTLEGTVYPKAKDKKQVKQMSKSSFESGEVAYLLDGGGTITRSAIWTQNVADGYPVFGTPSYYKLNVSGNEGEYTISVTGTNGADVKCGNGEIKDFYVGGGDKPLCVSVVGKSKTFMENGKKYQITYNVDSIELTKNEAKEDITATKTFKMQEDCTLKVTVKPSEKVEIVEQEKPSAGGGGNKGNGGSGDKGKGQGMGQGSEGTETGKGDGTGEAAGKQKGSGDIVGSSSGGEKESNYASTTILPTTKTSDQVETKAESPMIEQEQQNDTDEDNESVEAANSGGLEEGLKAGEDDEEDEQITVWEIVKQKVKDNPMMLVFVCLILAAIVGMGGLARLKKSRRL